MSSSVRVNDAVFAFEKASKSEGLEQQAFEAILRSDERTDLVLIIF